MHDFLTWASESYRSAFSEWLGIHFIVRTLVLLLLVWIALYIAAKVFHYIIAPLLILLFYHGLFRAYNFLFVETPMEWLYIKYYSEDKTLFSGTYLKLCDKVKQNRMKLAHTRYMGIIYQGHTRRAAKRLLIISLIVGSLWVTAFGIFNEFALDAGTNNCAPAATSESTPSTESAAAEEKSSETAAAPNTAGALTEPSSLPGAAGSGVFVSDFPDPVDLPEDGEIIFT
ncbi:MAG: hypothetical protein LBR83_01575, partial [Clostridiales bacterium]|nr:hypothetical protein [Clostridiales bacterium]